MRNSLIIFEFKRSRYFLATLISIIILLITFFAYGSIAYLIQPENKFLISVTFLGTMIGMSYILVLLLSGFVYHNILQISYKDGQLVITKRDEIIEEFKNQQIESLEFQYRGDIQWRATNPRFQRYKSRRRYRIKRSTFETELESFDKIILNKRIFLVKIKDFDDKDYFYKIIDWADRHEVKYALNELKFYAEFK